MISSINVEGSMLDTAFTYQGYIEPRNEEYPNGYTHLRVFKNGNVRVVNGQLMMTNVSKTASPMRRKQDVEFFEEEREYTIVLNDGNYMLRHATPIDLPPGVYPLDDETLKKKLRNARTRSRNAMGIVGFPPGVWKESDAQLFMDNEDGILKYRFMIVAKGIRELRNRIKEYAKKNELVEMLSPTRPSPRRLF